MNESTPVPASAPAPKRSPFGLPVLALIGLALLAAPRVVLHDLGIIEEGHPLAWLLALGPIVVWIAVVVAKRVPSPFLTLLAVGFFYGLILMLGHQLLWEQAFGGSVPNLGGPLGEVIPRVAAGISSIFTGTIIGAVAGLVAWGISALLKRRATA